MYESKASKQKLPFFNEFHPERVIIASRAYYNTLYGHYGEGIVTGFKEIRYVCGLSLNENECAREFSSFASFLKRLCLDLLLLTRISSSSHANPQLFEGVPEGYQKSKVERNLQKTFEVYDSYADSHPENAYRLHTEHMFDPQKNATLARNILGFLQEEPTLPIAFTRMPGWSS
ncbi:hypothetical protein GPECTOR_4g745 [Gonium pectorale]|uniref:Uncharacterized protein n=1 Tax=Gonium pectorale TaxID=33097 RepID=A0A150GXX1_GONPE|nr:hypothetical protein GPECTOR_4g745 [Gonium pectorale]|eukprot:KXZ54679.1 hypothetical protein GPECTOR_4g745 [Gonium pectorale]